MTRKKSVAVKRRPVLSRVALNIAKAKANAEQFVTFLRIHSNIPKPILEYQFHETRKWRFDFAWPSWKVALEVEGGIWTSGAHTRGKHFLSDAEKYNRAAVMGWKVLRVTPDTLARISTLTLLAEAFDCTCRVRMTPNEEVR